MTVVPLIDISALRGDDDEAKNEVGRQFDHAGREIGFMQITNHGVPEKIIEAMYRTSDEFFALPDEEKRRVVQPSKDAVRGYSSIGEQALAYSDSEGAPRDLHEKFDIGPVDVDRSDPYFSPERSGPHFLPNVWPERPSDMEAAWTAYYREMNTLARLIMSGFARGLGLPPDYFESMIDRDISMLRAINYPHMDTPPLPGQMRAGAHTDYGSLTIVRQEEAPGGLEVFTQDGDWEPVPVIPGAFVVNIGDLMAQWTNDEWISTRHRVRPPAPDANGNTRRMSLVFFHQPNYDAMIECLPTCLKEGATPRYEPISSGDHLTSKFARTIELAAG
ncbi:isopenicillin N synthase family dioxygenase [Gordonia aurantiaca]|uniref:isopenicillin N synthase family dioxygenase n=1 Tax=Gordonia sp. B21 TaxID=3151852 RepID=UPI003263F3D7